MAVLRPGGLLFVNVVARSPVALTAFLRRMKAASEAVRGRLLTARASDSTVNLAVLLIKGEQEEEIHRRRWRWRVGCSRWASTAIFCSSRSCPAASLLRGSDALFLPLSFIALITSSVSLMFCLTISHELWVYEDTHEGVVGGGVESAVQPHAREVQDLAGKHFALQQLPLQ